jgi:hypothetical protein
VKYSSAFWGHAGIGVEAFIVYTAEQDPSAESRKKRMLVAGTGISKSQLASSVQSHGKRTGEVEVDS